MAARPTLPSRLAATILASSTPSSPTAASTVKNSINYQTWRALGTVGGGEVISADSY